MCDVPPKRPIRQGTVDRVPWFTPNGLNPDSSPRARVFFGCLKGSACADRLLQSLAKPNQGKNIMHPRATH